MMLSSFKDRYLVLSSSKTRENMANVNPKFVLRNWILQDVITKVIDGDYELLGKVREVFQRPYEDHAGFEDYQAETPDWGKRIAISCSS